jgi:hypothetical protein
MVNHAQPGEYCGILLEKLGSSYRYGVTRSLGCPCDFK